MTKAYLDAVVAAQKVMSRVPFLSYFVSGHAALTENRLNTYVSVHDGQINSGLVLLIVAAILHLHERRFEDPRQSGMSVLQPGANEFSCIGEVALARQHERENGPKRVSGNPRPPHPTES